MLSKCYDNLTAVQMQNTGNNAWGGSVKFARDKAGPYKAGYCTTCTTMGSTADMVFDGDTLPIGWGAPTECQNGKMCNVATEPTSGEMTQ